MTRNALTTALLSLALLAAVPAHAQGVIKIGEVNSYKVQPAFLEPYKKGMNSPSRRSTPPVASTARSWC